MIDPTKEVKRSQAAGSSGLDRNKALQAVLFGLAFGFLLQKGGVAKYNVLIGALLLQDFTVMKVMLSAIIVGMVGIFFLERAGKVELKIKPLRLVSVTSGGLLFGAGFALAAYCPGTGAAALGQMNFDALFMMGGMMAGAYLFAEASGWISRKADTTGDYGKKLLPDIAHARRVPFMVCFGIALVAALMWLERINPGA